MGAVRFDDGHDGHQAQVKKTTLCSITVLITRDAASKAIGWKPRFYTPEASDIPFYTRVDVAKHS
jgi:hypothetical protein